MVFRIKFRKKKQFFLNKIDLIDSLHLENIKSTEECSYLINANLIITSAKQNIGIDELALVIFDVIVKENAEIN